MAPWHEHIPSITPETGQLDLQDFLDVDEDAMDDDLTPRVHVLDKIRSEFIRLPRCIVRLER